MYLNLEYFNSVAINNRETKNLYENSFFLNKVDGNNLFLSLFLAHNHIFLFCFICKYFWQNSLKKNKCQVHNYIQHCKDKAQNEWRVSAEAGIDNLTPLYYYYYYYLESAVQGRERVRTSVQRPQPHTTNPWKAVKDKIVGDKKETSDHANRKALALLLKPTSPTPSNRG